MDEAGTDIEIEEDGLSFEKTPIKSLSSDEGHRQDRHR